MTQLSSALNKAKYCINEVENLSSTIALSVKIMLYGELDVTDAIHDIVGTSARCETLDPHARGMSSLSVITLSGSCYFWKAN